MGVYNGTGYFISTEALKCVKISDIETRYPKVRDILLKENKARLPLEENSLLDLLQASGMATNQPIIQYGEAVCFTGIFEKYLDEQELKPDSGDFEMVDRLLNEEGYDYAVSNETEMTPSLETLNVILKEFGLISPYEVLETYWFLMPYTGAPQ
ncbi:hypothetical protein [Eubacterium sp. 1001713B170207_170306_E7]|uniref:hypothetical protein n=1 Tax=Eubacterium sp. 1001713B170207_170306_E7 TaxID=2787097 RepID=UPI00189BE60C|nr:hypothetical protein [Eubacterium sp. 1001713B170207_170306_E7]